MSDTPRTDELAQGWDEGLAMPSQMLTLARELERENIELRKAKDILELERCEMMRTMSLLCNQAEQLQADKERLDWLDQKIVSSWLDGKDFVVWDKSSPQPCSIREWLDAARKEAQP